MTSTPGWTKQLCICQNENAQKFNCTSQSNQYQLVCAKMFHGFGSGETPSVRLRLHAKPLKILDEQSMGPRCSGSIEIL